MNWGSLENFLAMGGYGFFVWTSYGVPFLLMVIEIYLLWRRRRTLKARLSLMRKAEMVIADETST
ncbi:MAG TPA: heme exporter protein CcmD [Pelomicrobium sp.]|nr:heme exporter protein CcmD [Pelomicrobium sp.]